MICTKCNSIIPDEAKFCPSCGAKCVSEKTSSEPRHCSKCGLELEKNAKFCSVCGTAVNAVSLEKQPDSDSLVSAMPNTAPVTETAPVSEGVPVPALAEGTSPVGATIPSGVPTPKYAPPAGAMPGDFGNSSPMPQYAPPTDGFGNMGNMGAAGSAAAVAAVPVKKKNGARVAIIIAAAVAVLLAATAIFFFTNKATFLSVFMGKSRYATMVEGNSIKDTVGKIDVGAISDGVKTASDIYGTAAATNYAALPTKYDTYAYGYGTTTVKCMASYEHTPAVDTAALIKLYNEILTDTYGTDAIRVTAGANINLSDSAKALIGNDANEILNTINGTTFTYDLAASENAIGMKAGTEGKLALDVKFIMNEDGTCYLAFPFASDKALMFKIESESAENSETTAMTASLELDEEEISRLIGEIVQIYLNNYEKAVTEMEKGSITVDGEEISGKLITAEFAGDALADMMKEIIIHIGDDEYFSGKIIEFVNNCGEELTVEEYKKAFSDAADDIKVESDYKFIVKTVIDRNGNTLGKSYAIDAYGKAEFAYKGNDKDFAVQFTYDCDGDKCDFHLTNTQNSYTASLVCGDEYDSFTASVDGVKTDDKSGTATFTFQENDDGEYKFTVSYSGIEKVKCFNKEVMAGTVTVTLNMPEGFAAADNELFTVLDGLTFTISNNVSDESQSVEIGVKTTAYGEISLNYSVSKTDAADVLEIPGNVIDVSDGLTGSLDAKTQKQLEDFSTEITDAINNNELLNKLFSSSISPIDPFDDDDDDDDILWGGDDGIIGIPEDNDDDDDDDDDYDFSDKVSHVNDNFNEMSIDKLSELTIDYTLRFYMVSQANDGSNPTLESKLYAAQDALNEISNYMGSTVNENTINVSMVREWRKSLKEFVEIVEECESLINE